MSFLFCFPGQGSQSVGMLNAFSGSTAVKQTLAEADEALKFSLSGLIANGPIEELNKTHRTQPAMLAAGVAVWRAWLEAGGSAPAVLAGHSLGEYSAMVASGTLSFGDALRLVEARGRYMQDAVPLGQGAMAAIVGLDDAAVEALCTSVGNDSGQIVEPVNYNAPGQVVIAGDRAAVETAMAAASESGARMVREIPVSAPAHSSLMAPAAQKLEQDLQGLALNIPVIPVLHNVDAGNRVDVDDIRKALVAQVHNPVRWVGCIQTAKRDFAVEYVIECGPGGVLRGMNRRIDKSLKHMAMDSPEALDSVLTTLAS